MARKCKSKTCKNRVYKKGAVYCAYHRALKRAQRKHWELTHPEHFKAKQDAWRQRWKERHPETYHESERRHQARIRARARAGDPVATAYKERHKETRRQCANAWRDDHPERVTILKRFQVAVKRREIQKPVRCQDCNKRKRPLVVWGLRVDDAGDLCWDAMVCWSCWWRRKRES